MALCRLLGFLSAPRSPLSGLSSAALISGAIGGDEASSWGSTRAWANWGVPSQPSASSTPSATRSLRRPLLLPALSAHPTTTGSHEPLTVKYPFSIEYNVDRTALVRSLITAQPLGIELLPGSVFNVPVRVDLLHRCVRYLRALWQQGTHKTKGRGEVSGGGKKPRPQKGSGRARQGSIRSPLWKGGGVSHGTTPRSHAHKLHAATRLLGMKCALSAKLNEGRLVVLDSLAPPIPNLDGAGGFVAAPAKPPTAWKAVAVSPKTKHMISVLTALLQDVPARSVLLVDCGEDGEDGGKLLRRATNNIPWAHVMSSDDVTVYHILKHHALVMSRPAVRALTQRLAEGVRVRKPLRHAWWLKQQAAFKEAEAMLRLPDASALAMRSEPLATFAGVL